NTRGQGFQNGQTEGFMPARERQDVRCGIDLGEALAIGHHAHIDGMRCGPYEALGLGSQRTIADDAQLVRSPLTQKLERLKQNRQILLMAQTAYVEDHRALACTQVGGLWAGREEVQIDAEGDL